MLLANGITVTVKRATASGVDRYGNATSTISTFDIAGCAWSPVEGEELAELGRRGVVIDRRLFLPYGSDIRHNDVVTIDGVDFAVAIAPGAWRSPYSGLGRGVVAALRRVEG
jgi:SPP1 family predicted phage head-tail adaptor